MKELLTAKEAAAYLGTTVRTLRGWNKQGIGPKRSIVGKNGVRYLREEIQNYLKNPRSTQK